MSLLDVVPEVVGMVIRDVCFGWCNSDIAHNEYGARCGGQGGVSGQASIWHSKKNFINSFESIKSPCQTIEWLARTPVDFPGIDETVPQEASLNNCLHTQVARDWF